MADNKTADRLTEEEFDDEEEKLDYQKQCDEDRAEITSVARLTKITVARVLAIGEEIQVYIDGPKDTGESVMDLISMKLGEAERKCYYVATGGESLRTIKEGYETQGKENPHTEISTVRADMERVWKAAQEVMDAVAPVSANLDDSTRKDLEKLRGYAQRAGSKRTHDETDTEYRPKAARSCPPTRNYWREATEDDE
jgi:hypothetical protein